MKNTMEEMTNYGKGSNTRSECYLKECTDTKKNSCSEPLKNKFINKSERS